MDKRRNKGFTLMEMLIVVAIIAILVAIAVPTFSSILSRTKEVTCIANRRSLLAQLAAERMDVGWETWELVWNEADPAVRKAWKEKYICPAGGEITVRENVIACSVHGDLGTDEDIPSVEKSLMDNFLAVMDTWTGQWPDNGPTNDNYRNSLYKSKYPTGWPAVELAGNTYYMQPYYYDKEGTSLLFANRNSDVQRNWNANAVYDEENGVWWTGAKTVGVANKTWDTLVEDMKKQGWTQVK